MASSTATTATIEEGDVLLTNDPYSCGGAISHLNDWLVMMPVFKDGRLIAWAAMFGHMTDVGGKVPGVVPTDAQHDLRGRRGHPADQDLQAGRAQRGRAEDHPQPVPRADWNRSDLNAIVAACRTAARRVQEICDRFGDDIYFSAMDALLERNYER